MSQMHGMAEGIIFPSHVGDTPCTISRYLMGMDYQGRSTDIYGTSP